MIRVSQTSSSSICWPDISLVWGRTVIVQGAARFSRKELQRGWTPEQEEPQTERQTPAVTSAAVNSEQVSTYLWYLFSRHAQTVFACWSFLILLLTTIELLPTGCDAKVYLLQINKVLPVKDNVERHRMPFASATWHSGGYGRDTLWLINQRSTGDNEVPLLFV